MAYGPVRCLRFPRVQATITAMLFDWPSICVVSVVSVDLTASNKLAKNGHDEDGMLHTSCDTARRVNPARKSAERPKVRASN